jgi:hypothetical protein
LFLSACSFLAFVRWIRDPESKLLALLWLAAMVALVYTHGIFGLALVVQNVIVLVLVLREEMFRHRLMWRWVLFQILTCALVAPVLMQMASLMGRREDINYAVDPPDVWQAIVFFPVPALCAGLLAGLTLWCLSRKDRKLEFSIEENRLGLMVLLAMFIIPTALLGAAGMKQAMLFGVRYRFIAAIGAMGITGIFALGWRNKCMRMAFVAALAALLTAQAAVSLHRSGVFAAQYDHLRGAKKYFSEPATWWTTVTCWWCGHNLRKAISILTAAIRCGHRISPVRRVRSISRTAYDGFACRWNGPRSCSTAAFGRDLMR